MDGNNNLHGHFTNLTPYTLTLVSHTPPPPPLVWLTQFPQTIQPGQTYEYVIEPNRGNSFLGAQRWHFEGSFTYRADTVNGPEFLTSWVTGCYCTGIYNNGTEKPFLGVATYNTSQPPAPAGHGFFYLPPTPNTPNPEIFLSQTNPWGSDITLVVQGNYTVDASSDPPQLAGLLNLMCAGGADTTCKFTPTGPPTFGLGSITAYPAKANCPTRLDQRIRRPVRGTDEPPPPGDPDWYSHTVEVARSASISVGGDVTVSAKANLFGIIASEVSATFGVEHEWSNTDTFSKESRVEVPQGWIGGIWFAPVVGKISGTLVVSTKVATYTITNFQEVKTAVQGDVKTGTQTDANHPPVDVLTYARPMTKAEIQQNCPALAGRKGQRRG